ncbi:MAG: ATP-binding protein, partial [Bacteroidales bacterium]|nr:ATP-binding protein [Bacteroidales bacterium]
LAVCFAPGELVREQIVLENNVEQVDQLGQFVKAFCARLELDRKSASGLRLALEETVVNVINYAYPKGEKGSVTVYADSNRKEVRFTIVDAGVPFDPTAVLSADTTLDVQNRPIGGLGILLTRKLMDSVSYCRKGDKNVLTLTKIIL